MKCLLLSRRAVGSPSSAVPFGLLAMVLSVIIPGVGGASELERRLEGTWAASAKDCEAYLSGRLDSDDMDQSTRRRFGVATIRNGLFSYKYQMASCQLGGSRRLDAATFSFHADCLLRGTNGNDIGVARFISGHKVALSFKAQSFFSDVTLTRCAR